MMWPFQPSGNNKFRGTLTYCEYNQNSGNIFKRITMTQCQYSSDNLDFSADYDENDYTGYTTGGRQGFVKSKVVVPYRQITNDLQQNYNHSYSQQNYGYHSGEVDNYYGGQRQYAQQPNQYTTRNYNNNNNGYHQGTYRTQGSYYTGHDSRGRNYQGNNGYRRAYNGYRGRAGYALLGGQNQIRNDYKGPYGGHAFGAQNHQRRNYSAVRPIKCYTCGESFWNKNDLFAHRLDAHSTKNFYCPVCNKQFSAFHQMKEHEKTHTIQACSECPEVFKFKDSLLAHKEHAHPAPPAIEEPVNKSFSNFNAPVAASTPAASFTSCSQDSGVHVKLESHSCNHCIKSFDSEEKLLSHAKIHTESEPQSLAEHQSPSEPQVMNCPFCIKKFSSRRELTLHLEAAHTRLFYCRKCPAEFSSQAELDSHSKVHS